MSNAIHQSIPTVDLGSFLNGNFEDREKIAENVDRICRDIGFLVIENHGISENIITDAWKTAEMFFALSTEEKLISRSDDAGCPRGYTPLEGESLARTKGGEAPSDLKETFSSGPLAPPAGHGQTSDFHFYYGPNIWPNSPSNFEQVWSAYYQAMEKLGADLMSMLAVALNIDQNFFQKYHTHHISALRCQNYPVSKTSAKSGQLRAGAHTDYGSVTILKPDPDVAGLEVKSREGHWIKAPMVKDGFIINIGDLLAHWTNNRWVSTLHRVVEPNTTDQSNAPRRQSIAYFMNPNYDAVIETLPSCSWDKNITEITPVTAGAYLMKKFNQSI